MEEESGGVGVLLEYKEYIESEIIDLSFLDEFLHVDILVCKYSL